VVVIPNAVLGRALGKQAAEFNLLLLATNGVVLQELARLLLDLLVDHENERIIGIRAHNTRGRFFNDAENQQLVVLAIHHRQSSLEGVQRMARRINSNKPLHYEREQRVESRGTER
jgi:hypothetical protein